MSTELKEQEQIVIPDSLPLLPVRDVVIFPFMIVPLFVGREKSIGAVDMALAKDRLVLIAAQKDMTKEDPDVNDLYDIGTVGVIMRMLKLPDGRVKILLQGLSRAKISSFLQEKPAYVVSIEKIKEATVSPMTLEIEAMMRNVR